MFVLSCLLVFKESITDRLVTPLQLASSHIFPLGRQNLSGMFSDAES